MKLLLLGPPGSGKTSQTFLVREQMPQFCYINHLQLLREEVHTQTSLGQEVEALTSRGELIPDHLLVALITKRMRAKECQQGYVIDGFPTTVSQATKLAASGESIDGVIMLQVSDEASLLERLRGRWVHRSSGRVYHEAFAVPHVPGKDNETGEPLHQRDDDRPEIAKLRLSSYRRNEAAIMEHYKQPDRIRSFATVDASGTLDDVLQRLLPLIKRSASEDVRRPWWKFW